ncbi:Hypothetical predicted protein [Pelobates cultripes]|uniref:Uncharacterized protein n=1 Tax=Pelobates cultripes TaxID=61616 RepID=A0AAD1S2A6_PELCU|nr:Hypothetical predicted protein [Pelobates cultripes]
MTSVQSLIHLSLFYFVTSSSQYEPLSVPHGKEEVIPKSQLTAQGPTVQPRRPQTAQGSEIRNEEIHLPKNNLQVTPKPSFQLKAISVSGIDNSYAGEYKINGSICSVTQWWDDFIKIVGAFNYSYYK